MLIYLFDRRQYKRSLTILLSAWFLDFIARVVLFLCLGDSFRTSILNIFLFSFGNVLVGLIIRTIIVRKKSVPVEDKDLDNNIDIPVS